MILVKRNNVRFHFDPDTKKWQVLANEFIEVDDNMPYRLKKDYILECYELVETDEPLDGVLLNSNGKIVCNEFIEGCLEDEV